MAVRTFFWDANIVGRLGMLKRRMRRLSSDSYFAVGNAGDIYNADVVQTTYGTEAVNADAGGHRLLLIGSTAHRIQPGDVVCGIGSKGAPIPTATEVQCTLRAVRGPLTREAFRAAGHDVSGIVSELDPGLLIRFDVPDSPAVRGRVGFLPHYRERSTTRELPQGVRRLSIDGTARDVARRIQQVEVLYTSSLHGMVFAHALGRPCVLVEPRTAEPAFKYQDYLASVDRPWTGWTDLESALRAPAPDSPVDLTYTREQFGLPDLAELRQAGVAD